MGIESDQLVFDYLSRVGDLAQQRQVPSATRMRLVSELRNEIDRRRAKATADSPAAVRRILDRLGTPDEIVAAAGAGTPGEAAGTGTWAAVPTQRHTDEPAPRPKGLRRVVPRPRPPESGAASAADDDAPAPPHLASAQELGDSAMQPDWWRVGTTPLGLGESVPGFVGGVEIPEILKPPPEKDEAVVAGGKGKAAEAVAEPEPEVSTPRRRLVRLPRLDGWSNPLLLLAAALLVAGAALGNWFALVLGWLIAYASRRLSPAESKGAVLVLPGLAAAGGIVWLWGRMNDRWGEPIAEGHMNEAIGETWPWVVRGAAVGSALYLVWRSQRRRG
ncbi:hypothetical protein [Streptomyces sp. NBC_00038]|uniref:hypothetical protein n=1 Tax=Streptomyces sp. NBC_00038 TaxID=2903615 RepID=UPI00225A82F5|nr:hypothetical protein [Streptomyces sp. NBC_00038]MCX5558630.1 hypothetical protein [Streptomyces sp. NBC_00038]